MSKKPSAAGIVLIHARLLIFWLRPWGLVQMGEREDRLDFQRSVSDDEAIMIPAGTWHNVTNTGRVPLKLYTIYAPPEHPLGAVHRTKAEAMAAHRQLAASR